MIPRFHQPWRLAVNRVAVNYNGGKHKAYPGRLKLTLSLSRIVGLDDGLGNCELA